VRLIANPRAIDSNQRSVALGATPVCRPSVDSHQPNSARLAPIANIEHEDERIAMYVDERAVLQKEHNARLRMNEICYLVEVEAGTGRLSRSKVGFIVGAFYDLTPRQRCPRTLRVALSAG
jgi:hypothetical protein